MTTYLRKNMLECNAEHATAIYQIGFNTFCFYQPILFEETIAVTRKRQTNRLDSEPETKVKKVKASKITYKDGKPIERITDGPDTELKPSSNVKRTLIKNYYRMSRLAKILKKEK
jgi:hypothetical protein